MNILDYVSVKASVQEFLRMTGYEGELDKSDLISWASDAADRIYTDEQFVHKIALLSVHDYRTQLPDDFRVITQVAFKPDIDDWYKAKVEIMQYTQKALGTECELEINIVCPQCHSIECSCDSPIVEVDADQLWRTSNPQYSTAYMNHFYKYGGNTQREKCYYHPDWILIKHSTNSYFGLKHHIKDCLNLNVDNEIEYSLEGRTMFFNVKTGYVLVSYLGDRVDEEGYRYIPNLPIVMKAISYAMVERWSYREYFKTKEQKDRIFWQQHVELTEKFIARAKSELQTPEYDEWSSFVKKFWHKVIPEYSYEENLYRGGDPKYRFRYADQSYNMRGYNRDTHGGRRRYNR